MRRKISCVAAFVLVMSVPICLHGLTVIPIDNFESGNLNDWTTVDLSAGQPWGPGVFDVSNGELRMAHTGSVPVPPGTPVTVDVLIAAWNPSTDPLFSNGFLRAQVRIDEVANVAAMHMRADLTTFTTYFMYTNTGTRSVHGEESSNAAPLIHEQHSPLELIEESLRALEAATSEELLDRLKTASPSFFEQIVVKLLLAMGYGGATGEGLATGRSGDAGIDGVIKACSVSLYLTAGISLYSSRFGVTMAKSGEASR